MGLVFFNWLDMFNFLWCFCFVIINVMYMLKWNFLLNLLKKREVYIYSNRFIIFDGVFILFVICKIIILLNGGVLDLFMERV